MSLTEYQVPQDLGPSPHPLNLSDGASYFTSVDYVTVDAYSVLTVDVYWGEDVVNPNMYSWEFSNATGVDMHWDTYVLPAQTHRLEFTYMLERGGPPKWGHNDTAFSVNSTPVPAPGAVALLLVAGAVGMWKGRGR